MSSHLRSQLAGAALAISFIAFYFVSGARAQSVTALNGVYNGTYRCAQGATTLKLSITATAGGELSPLFTFYLPPGTQNQSYTYRLIGQYDPRTARFSLMPVAWETAHPSNFSMVGLNGTFDSNELTGTVIGAGCSTFQVERERGQPGRAAAATPPPTAAAPRPQAAPAQERARPSAPPAQTRQANIDKTIKDTAATTATAQAPRKQACELLTVADVEAAIGVSPLRAIDPQKKGDFCTFQKAANQNVFSISVNYSDAPDADAVIKWLKFVETQTYKKARPASGIGDDAYYTEQFGNRSLPKTLTVFIAGKMTLALGDAPSEEQLRALAEKALGGASRTGFAYNGAVPVVPRPVSPSSTNAASSSPLDALKSALTKKADAGDSGAEEALAGLYRYGRNGAASASKADYQAAIYWYKRASDHGVASASYQLATMYRQGLGVSVNDDAAKALFTKAADAGYVRAMVPLAFMYAAQPDFVSKRRAAEWALKAAESDDPEGHLISGYLWDKGLLSFDDAESGKNAVSEYRKAADRGNCTAMMNTGGLYFNGSHGLRQDAPLAQAWFDRAQSCFGTEFEEMRQKAVQYRSLAAAGHLPAPPAPDPLPKGSRFFNPKSPGQRNDALVEVVGAMLELTALSVAYLAAHPEEVSKLSAPNRGPYGDSELQHDLLMRRIVGLPGVCTIPGGC